MIFLRAPNERGCDGDLVDKTGFGDRFSHASNRPEDNDCVADTNLNQRFPAQTQTGANEHGTPAKTRG